MATPTYDIIDKSSYNKSKDGIELTRAITVEGIVANGWYDKITEAVDAIGAVVGDGHPDLATCKLRSIDAIGVSGDIVVLSYVYRTSEGGGGQFEDDAIEVGASVVQVETNKDKDGDEIELSYTYPANYDNSSLASVTKETGHMVSLLTPEKTWTKHQSENSSPETTADTYVGKVNSAAWRGYAARKWLCTGIIGRSTDGGDNYEVTYTFQYDPGGWDPTVVFIKDDGKPPKTTDANSEKVVTLYNEVDFNGMGL